MHSPIKIALIVPKYTIVTNYNEMMAHNIAHGLRNDKRVEIVKEVTIQNDLDLLQVDWNGAVHIFAINLRYWHSIKTATIIELKRKITGKLFHFYDSGHRPIHNPHVINFAVMDWTIDPKKDVHIGWAADVDLFHINKSRNDETLRILIDHPHWPGATIGHDASDTIACICNLFRNDKTQLDNLNQQLGTNWKNIHIRRLISDGIEDLPYNTASVEYKYNRKSVSQRQLSDEMNRAHIFFISHMESLGMSVLEAALSGCVIVTPDEYIKPSVLKYVNHVTFSKNCIDSLSWKNVLANISPESNRQRVVLYTWKSCINNVIEGLYKHACD